MKSCEVSVVFANGDVSVSVLRWQTKISFAVRKAVVRDRMCGLSYREIGLKRGVSKRAAWVICHEFSAQNGVSMKRSK